MPKKTRTYTMSQKAKELRLKIMQKSFTRNIEIYHQWQSGEFTLQDLANIYGVSRQRIKQIIDKTKLNLNASNPKEPYATYLQSLRSQQRKTERNPYKN